MKEGIIKHMKNNIAWHDSELKKIEEAMKNHPDECLLKIDWQSHSDLRRLCKAIITNINEGTYEK